MDDDIGQVLFSGGYGVAVILIGWSFIASFSGWDRNLDGMVTISDWRDYIGTSLTLPFLWAHSFAPGFFQFLEQTRPVEPTWRTAGAGLVSAYVLGLAVTFAGVAALGMLVAFVTHWRGEKKPN